MSSELFRLVYYSRNQIVGDTAAFASDLDRILSSSQFNNARAGLTGALLFDAGCFGQVLEGPRRAIEATFERIQRDPRHRDVSLLAFQPAERAFPNWSMRFVGAKRLDAECYAGIANQSGFDRSRVSADALLARLHSLALEEERSISA